MIQLPFSLTLRYNRRVSFRRSDLEAYVENFMAIFTTLGVAIWFSTDTLGIFATLGHVFTMCVFCHLCYILL